MIENLVEITKEQLVGKAQELSFQNYRFVTASCVDLGDETLQVTYHFDKNYKLENYRLNIPRGEEVQSISGIYFCAVLVENEMKELFGLNVVNLAIDYQGHLLLSEGAPEDPMRRNQIVIEKREAK